VFGSIFGLATEVPSNITSSLPNPVFAFHLYLLKLTLVFKAQSSGFGV
jgi:hypothetical protein